jgi:hypothetical protein
MSAAISQKMFEILKMLDRDIVAPEEAYREWYAIYAPLATDGSLQHLDIDTLMNVTHIGLRVTKEQRDEATALSLLDSFFKHPAAASVDPGMFVFFKSNAAQALCFSRREEEAASLLHPLLDEKRYRGRPELRILAVFARDYCTAMPTSTNATSEYYAYVSRLIRLLKRQKPRSASLLPNPASTYGELTTMLEQCLQQLSH